VRIRLLAFLMAAQLCVAAEPARAEGSLRHLEYTASSTIDGQTVHGTIRLDLRAVGRDRTFDFDLQDDIGGVAGETFRVDLDRLGGLSSHRAGALRAEEEALVYFFVLSHENMTGVDPGDHWMRENATAEGNQVTRYTVLHADGELVDLGVARAFARHDGSSESWNGHLIYDSASIVPVLIELNCSTSRLSLKLTSDSFKRN
jgi:hypothetical protein